MRDVKITTKQRIVHYLKYVGGCSGSELESQAQEWQTKASVISRRARELAQEGTILRSIGERGTVQYSLPAPEPIPMQLFQENYSPGSL